MNPNYISKNIDELLDGAPPQIHDILSGDEINNTAKILGNNYKLPLNLYTALANLIFFILIGALKPEDVVKSFKDVLKLSEDDSYKLASDLEKSLLEKVRISLFLKPKTDVVKLEFAGEKSVDELRKEILDTTKRESAFVKSPSAPPQKKKTIILTPGSRSELMEHMKILDSIPTDEEVSARLDHIKEQVANLNKKENDYNLNTNTPTEILESMTEKGDRVVVAEEKTATYSKAPTKYNIDPYKEIPAY